MVLANCDVDGCVIGGADGLRSGRSADGEVGANRAIGEFEGADARLPGSAAGGLDVFGGVPEGAVIHRVYSEHAVVAPAGGGMRLRAGASDDFRFALGHFAQRVAHQAAGVADGGVDRGTGYAEANSHVAHVVHGDAAHPAIQTIVRGVGALLVDGGNCCIGIAQFVPTHAGAAAASIHRVVEDQRFMVAVVAVGQAIHAAISNDIQPL